MFKYFLNLVLFYLFFSTYTIATLSHPLYLTTSCLASNHVTNFSLLPTSRYHFNSTSNYYNILFFSLQNLRFTGAKSSKPSIIILPRSKEELASSVICSRKGHYEVLVRSGGHSYEGLSSVSYDRKPYVIIDLMNLDKIFVDLTSKTAWVESGATLGQLYYTIADQSKGVYGFSAGTCPTVGVGGHFSGGGFGLLSRKYGLSADNIVDALLVDSGGRVMDRATMGEDVFWAIRGGGGGSFGIIYAWKIKLLKVPPKVTTFQASREGNIHNISQLVHRWQYVGPYLDDIFYLSITLSADNSQNETSVSATFSGLYLGQRREALSIINNVFPELKVRENEGTESNWIESVLYFSYLNEGSTIKDLMNRTIQGRDYFKSKSDYVTNPIPIQAIQGAMNVLAKEPKGYIILDPYGGQMARIADDFIAFPHRKGNLFGIQYVMSWDKEDNMNSEKYIAWIRGFYEFMTPFVSSNPRAAYVNYLDLDIGEIYNDVNSTNQGYNAVERGRVWGQKYFLKNYDRLVEIKTIIDPCNFFRHPQGIPSKLSPSNNRCHNY